MAHFSSIYVVFRFVSLRTKYFIRLSADTANATTQTTNGPYGVLRVLNEWRTLAFGLIQFTLFPIINFDTNPKSARMKHEKRHHKNTYIIQKWNTLFVTRGKYQEKEWNGIIQSVAFLSGRTMQAQNWIPRAFRSKPVSSLLIIYEWMATCIFQWMKRRCALCNKAPPALRW